MRCLRSTRTAASCQKKHIGSIPRKVVNVPLFQCQSIQTYKVSDVHYYYLLAVLVTFMQNCILYARSYWSPEVRLYCAGPFREVAGSAAERRRRDAARLLLAPETTLLLLPRPQLRDSYIPYVWHGALWRSVAGERWNPPPPPSSRRKKSKHGAAYT